MLTEVKFKNKMVVILAGYENDIEDLMRSNPGLKSRLSEKLHFVDFTVIDACKMFEKRIAAEGALSMSIEAVKNLPALMQTLIAAPGWSNGRDVDTWTKRVFAAVASRLAQQSSDAASTTLAAAISFQTAIEVVDLRVSLDIFLASKQVSTPSAHSHSLDQTTSYPPTIQYASAAPPARSAPAISVAAPVTAVCASTNLVVDAPIVKSSNNDGSDAHRLAPLQGALESLGYQFNDMTDVRFLAAIDLNSETGRELMTRLRGISATAAALLADYQRYVQEQLELERLAAIKRQRPTWICRVCGRRGCNFAPYIDGYEEY